MTSTTFAAPTASLQMYDFGDLVIANDALWRLIRDGLRHQGHAAPDSLTRGPDLMAIWRAPDMLLSQTCGYPFRAQLNPIVALVGTPDYGVPDCPPGQYCSYFVARKDDPRSELAAFDGVALAYNDPMSQSGWAAPQTYAAELGLHLPAGLVTQGHRLTVRAVADGRADIGAVDAVTWRHLMRLDENAQKLKVIARTPPSPGLPLITAQHGLTKVLFDTVAQAIADLPAPIRTILGLRGLIAIPASAYLAVPNPPPPDQISV
ncbi:phosphate/phosphite/phosphonate ABC transporter substrate-binding protein [Pseudorhodobacter wandonensis]|uniref:phosphate/phosphite/phosphonate ABC transporter substrate-binding protein n=1 Tax=Pseudorhodobacter wandonensis TaxID=1120568 RepID=UPI000AFAA5D0|nr:PhnD/SsuA/transferrin family substrate-binding protein [Pseudorhodobacter wandonensis]